MKSKLKPLLIAMLATVMVACGEKDNDGQTPNDNNNGNNQTSTIAVGRIGNGSITIGDYPNPNAYGIDFDKDGVLEFSINGEGDNTYLAYQWTEGGNNIVASTSAWDYLAPLAQNTVIGPQSNFAGQGDAMLEDFNSLPEKFYVGCRFVLSDGVHYGWISVRRQNGTLNWEKCAYNTNKNESIEAGRE